MTVDLATLPSRRDEGWKWSDLRAAVGDEPIAHFGAEPPVGFAGLGADSEALVLDLGDLAASPGTGHQGIRVERVEGANAPAWAEHHATAHVTARRVIAAVPTACVIEISDVIDQPIVITHAPVTHERLAIVVRDGASAKIARAPWLPETGAAFHLLDVGVQAGGALELVNWVGAQACAASLLTGVHLSKDATFSQTSLTMGAKLARLETHVAVNGPGAQVSLNGVSLLAGDRHGDHTTLVTHNAPDATTREVFRTVATDAGRGVFQGKIKVDRLAQKTDAEMHHAALILGDNASVNAKPELEIYADDVACAHGNTSGQLDDTALFYMRQRGLPEARAKALLTRAFIGEALDGVTHEGLRAVLDAQVDAWLEDNL